MKLPPSAQTTPKLLGEIVDRITLPFRWSDTDISEPSLAYQVRTWCIIYSIDRHISESNRNANEPPHRVCRHVRAIESTGTRSAYRDL